jgi:hypothetical protein
MSRPLGETRDEREALTKRALADATLRHIAGRRLRQTNVARWGGFSRSYLRDLLRAEKCCSLFLFLELCHGLRIDDPCELLREILDRRDALRRERSEVAPCDASANQG